MTETNSAGQTPSEIPAKPEVRDPEDLDIETIAQHCGATIRYKPLSGCEARIMGLGADQWIKNFRADQYWVKEESIPWSNQSVLSLSVGRRESTDRFG